MLPIDKDILINQWIQDVKPISDLTDWYDELADTEKKELLINLVSHCRQARAVNSDGVIAVTTSGLNPRRSAGVLLSRGTSVENLNKLASLRNADGKDAFVLLLNLLKIADNRRKSEEEPGSCSHWWHRDLSDDVVLRDILQEHGNDVSYHG